MAAPVIESLSSTLGTMIGAQSINRPSGVLAGDLLISITSCEGAGDDIAIAGFGPVAGVTKNCGTHALVVQSKIATAAEPASYSLNYSTTLGATGKFQSVLYRISGADRDTPFEAAKTKVGSTRHYRTNFPTDVSTSQADVLVLAVASAADGDLPGSGAYIGWKSGWIETYDDNSATSQSDPSLGIAFFTQAVPGNLPSDGNALSWRNEFRSGTYLVIAPVGEVTGESTNLGSGLLDVLGPILSATGFKQKQKLDVDTIETACAVRSDPLSQIQSLGSASIEGAPEIALAGDIGQNHRLGSAVVMIDVEATASSFSVSTPSSFQQLGSVLVEVPEPLLSAAGFAQKHKLDADAIEFACAVRSNSLSQVQSLGSASVEGAPEITVAGGIGQSHRLESAVVMVDVEVAASGFSVSTPSSSQQLGSVLVDVPEPLVRAAGFAQKQKFDVKAGVTSSAWIEANTFTQVHRWGGVGISVDGVEATSSELFAYTKGATPQERITEVRSENRIANVTMETRIAYVVS